MTTIILVTQQVQRSHIICEMFHCSTNNWCRVIMEPFFFQHKWYFLSWEKQMRIKEERREKQGMQATLFFFCQWQFGKRGKGRAAHLVRRKSRPIKNQNWDLHCLYYCAGYSLLKGLVKKKKKIYKVEDTMQLSTKRKLKSGSEKGKEKIFGYEAHISWLKNCNAL